MEYEITSQSKFSFGIREIWHYREMLYFFTWRDLKVKYKQTLLGFAWAVIQPLLLMIIFFHIGNALNISHESLPPMLFSFTGLILWFVFANGLMNAGNSMVSNADIIKKIYFPRLIIPISAVLSSLFDFTMSFIIFIGMILYYIFLINFHLFIVRFLILFPISLCITVISTLGLGSLLASLNIKYRDFRYLIPFIVQILFFVSPVLYPATFSQHDWVKYVFAINPMYSAIELFRSGINGYHLHKDLLTISIISALIMFMTGLYYFRNTEAYFADLA